MSTGEMLLREALEYWCRCEPVPEDLRLQLAALSEKERKEATAAVFTNVD